MLNIKTSQRISSGSMPKHEEEKNQHISSAKPAPKLKKKTLNFLVSSVQFLVFGWAKHNKDDITASKLKCCKKYLKSTLHYCSH